MKKIIKFITIFLMFIASVLSRSDIHKVYAESSQVKFYCKLSGEVKINDLTTLTFVFEDIPESINATGFTFELLTNIELQNISFEKCSSNNIDNCFTIIKEEDYGNGKYKYGINISIDYSKHNVSFQSGNLCSMVFALPSDTTEDDLRIQFTNTEITSKGNIVDDKLIYHEGENISLQIKKEGATGDDPYNFIQDGIGFYFKQNGPFVSNRVSNIDVYYINTVLEKPTTISFYLKSNYRLYEIAYTTYGNDFTYQYVINGSLNDEIEEIVDESQPGFYFYNVSVFISVIDSDSLAFFENGLLCSIDFIIKSDIENRVLLSSFFEKAENADGEMMEIFDEDNSIIESVVIPPSNEIEISQVRLDDNKITFNNKIADYSPLDSSQTSSILKIEMSKGNIEYVKVGENRIFPLNGSYTIELGDYGSETRVIISLIADDEKTREEYEVGIIRQKSNNSKLKKIGINAPNDDYSPKLLDKDGNNQIIFDKDNKEYTIGIISSVNSIILTPTVDDYHSKIYYNDIFYESEDEILIEDVTSSFQIKVVAQDDSFSIYSFNIKVLSDDVSLSSIEVKGILENGDEVSIGKLVKNGDNYELTFKNDDVKAYVVNATASSINSSITYSPNKYYFVQGLTETGRIIVNVASESGIKKNYIVTVTKKSTIKEFDSSIVVKNVDTDDVLLLTKDSNINNYYYEVSNEVNNVSVNVTSNTPLSSVDGEGEYHLPLSNPIILKLTSVTGESITINIHINYLGSSDDNKIVDIALLDKDGNTDIHDILGNIFEFDENVFSYSITVPYEVDSVCFQVQKTSSMSSISGDGVKYLIVGTNQFVIYAISASGQKGEVYTIKISRNESTENPYLSSILINGSTIEGFSSDKLDYSIMVDRNTEQIDIQCVLSSSNSSMNFTNGTKELTLGRNLFSITVLSALNEEIEYTITIFRAENKNTISNIAIYNGDKELSSYIYNKDIYEIELDIPYSISSLSFYVEYDGEYGSIKGEGTKHLIEGLNLFEIYVVSECEVKGEIYTFKITRAFVNKNNFLSSLVVISSEKSLLSDFNKERTKYAIVVAEEDTMINISASAESTLSQISGLGDYEINNLEGFSEKGISNINIIVTSEFGENRVYSLTIYLEGVELLDDNNISSVSIKSNSNEVIFFSEFDEKILEYTLNVPFKVSSITIECESNGSITGEGTYQLFANSQKVIEIFAISDKGTKGSVYTFVINRLEANENTNIKNLFINGINQNISSNNTYSLEFEYSISNVYIGLELENETAEVSVKHNGNRIDVNDLLNFSIGLVEGNNIINFTINADNDVSRVFSLTIKREYKLIDLASLSIKGVNLLDNEKKGVVFNPEVYIYFVEVPFEVTSLEIDATINESGFSIIIEKNNLNIGNNIVLVKVVSNLNSNEYKTYELHVERKLKLSDKISIQDFVINENNKFINDFKDEITNYSFDVNSNISEINISISFNGNEDEENPTIEIIGGEYLSFGENEVIVIITSSDGTKSKTYSLKVYRRNVTLSQARIDEIEEFRFDFRNDVNEYTYQVPSKVSTIHLSFDVDTSDTRYVLSNDRLKVGKNELTIDVYSKNVKVKTITLIIYRTDGNVSTQITPIIIGCVVGGVAVICIVTLIIIKKRKDYEKERKSKTKEKKRKKPLKK